MNSRPSTKSDSKSEKNETKKTILLVEDEPAALKLFSEILNKAGYDVIETTNGQEAIDHAQGDDAGRIDLLVSDLVMPDVGGLELASRFRDAFPGTKILLLSGYTEDIVILEEKLSRNTHFLPKPVRAETLKSKVQELLAE